jgi:hypothetical protein
MTLRFRSTPTGDERLRRLAQGIEALARRDQDTLRRMQEIAEMRRQAARALHEMCQRFVESLNQVLASPVVELSPDEYTDHWFHDPGVNVIQINLSGRLVQIAFEAPEGLTSTEKLKTPYTLEGGVRCYNQDLLERVAIPEMLLFCRVAGAVAEWVLVDPRTQRVFPFGE